MLLKLSYFTNMSCRQERYESSVDFRSSILSVKHRETPCEVKMLQRKTTLSMIKHTFKKFHYKIFKYF